MTEKEDDGTAWYHTLANGLAEVGAMAGFVAMVGAWIVGVCIFVGICIAVPCKLIGWADDVGWLLLVEAFVASVIMVTPATYGYIRDSAKREERAAAQKAARRGMGGP